MKDQILGILLLAVIGATFFDRLIDIMMFAACVYAFAFVLAELGVLLGWVERK
jgi:hypothetical protein